MWAHVTPDLWVASLGAVHLGRVEKNGEIFQSYDHLSTLVGSYTDELRARQAVTDRTDAAVAYVDSGATLPGAPRRGSGRLVAAIVVGCLVLAVAATALVLALLR